ncbi:MAG: HlyD family efflux transporter periplasmic adaptor subunit [Planctomycetaceae bacterium]
MTLRFLVPSACLAAIVGVDCALARAQEDVTSSTPIEVKAVLVRLIDEADVPAREAGVLEEIRVREGDVVRKGAILARVDDTLARLTRDRAAIELEIAEREAENDVDIRYARKKVEVAQAELDRGLESRRAFRDSVSQSEIESLQLAVERSRLEIEQAEHDRTVAGMTRALKRNELDTGEQNVARRKVAAPIDGVVVEIHRRGGEWVQPGDRVLRIVRMDRLRAEGFIDAAQSRAEIRGAPAELRVLLPDDPQATFAGKVVFVSPEIDPVNGQVRVWAEFDNPDSRLQPGLRGTMTLAPPVSASP